MKENNIYQYIGQAVSIIGLAMIYVGIFIIWILR